MAETDVNNGNGSRLKPTVAQRTFKSFSNILKSVTGKEKLKDPVSGPYQDGAMPGIEIDGEYSVIYTGYLYLDTSDIRKSWFPGGEAPKMENGHDCTLTTREFVFHKHQILLMDDIVAVSILEGSNKLTIHAYPSQPISQACLPFPAAGGHRSRTDISFSAPSPAHAAEWAKSFHDLHCYVRFVPNPHSGSSPGHGSGPGPQGLLSTPSVSLGSSPLAMASLGDSEVGSSNTDEESYQPIAYQPRSRTMAVFINPKSGRGRGVRAFRKSVQPILELAGFKLTVHETTGPRHAEEMAASIDLASCPDGIICVGGDGIVHEVLNGFNSRADSALALRVPLGVIPTGSDNSLVFSVLGVRDPVSAAMNIVRGGTVAVDGLLLRWEASGTLSLGLNSAYFGFMSNVLETSVQYQSRFGPLKYLVAGTTRFIHLTVYNIDVQYQLPVQDTPQTTPPASSPPERVHASDASMVVDLNPVVLALRNLTPGFEAPRPKQSPPATPWVEELAEGSGIPGPTPVSRSRRIAKPKMGVSRMGGWMPLDESTDGDDPGFGGRSLKGSSLKGMYRRMTGSNADQVMYFDDTASLDVQFGAQRELEAGEGGQGSSQHGGECPSSGQGSGSSSGANFGDVEGSLLEDKGGDRPGEEGGAGGQWVTKKGPFLAVILCNHKCQTVQCFDSLKLAPLADSEDGMLDLILVRPMGRFSLLRFLILLQVSAHVALPGVEYVKCQSIRVIPGSNQHNVFGMDGELLPIEGSVLAQVLPKQCLLIGRKKSKYGA